jgi:hypothetical protein
MFAISLVLAILAMLVRYRHLDPAHHFGARIRRARDRLRCVADRGPGAPALG